MNISHFERIRINSESGVDAVFQDVQCLGNSRIGFMTVAHEIPSMPKDKCSKHKVEVRKKDRQIALITYKYSDAEIPEWWRDAEVLYSWEQK